MNKIFITAFFIIIVLAACKPTATPTILPADTATPKPTVVPPTAETIAEMPSDVETAPPFAGLALYNERGKYFNTSGNCATCHTKMRDERGANVSNDTMWRATMMANAARDPYWQAAVRYETEHNPELRAVIADKCANCHMAMAQYTTATDGGAPEVLDGYLRPADELHKYAIDGVSCALCHQIEPDGLGEPRTFSGGFVIDPDLPTGERVNYGPFPASESAVKIMQGLSGFVPVQSDHMGKSSFCATCHTLYTPYLDANGEIAGEFPEQMAFFEWSHSDYAGEQQCQDCHEPPAQGEIVISVTGGKPRSPVAQHIFVGGNSYILRVFRRFGEELAVTASSQHFDDKIASVREQIGEHAAAVALENVTLAEVKLTVDVVVENHAGHKFPSGFPSRRAWLHLTVTDAAGDVVFESGGMDAAGYITGNANDEDAAAYEPHYATITSADQVQIYEPILGTTEGAVTTVLLYGAGYLKDNRLLPTGFDKTTAGDDIAVHGAAANDADFDGGGDTVRYEIDLDAASAPFTVDAELLYQAIGYRWANNLREQDGAEIDKFMEYYDAVPNAPEVAASARQVVN